MEDLAGLKSMKSPPSDGSPCGGGYFMDYMAYKVRSVCFLSGAVSAARIPGTERSIPLLATGSWDEQSNQLQILRYETPSKDEMELQQEMNMTSNEELQREYVPVATAIHDGDVSCIKFLPSQGKDLVVTGSSRGSIQTFAVEQPLQRSSHELYLNSITTPEWMSILQGNISAMDIHQDSATIVAAGENGKIVKVALDEPSNQEFIRGESCAISGIQLLGCQTTFAVTSSSPTCPMKIWDLTSNRSTAIIGFEDSTPGKQYTSVCSHPTRPELLAVGAKDGSVCLWDRRQLDMPVMQEHFHGDTVRSLQFHSSSPQFLFSCSDDGIVYSWNFNSSTRKPSQFKGTQQGLSVKPVHEGFLPWNALDVHGYSDTLILGGDNNGVLLYENVSKDLLDSSSSTVANVP